MKNLILLSTLLAWGSLIFFETATAQRGIVTACDPAQRITVPQLAKVCSVKPAFTPKYKQYFLIIGGKPVTRVISTNGIPNHNIGIFPIIDDACGSGRPTALAPHDTTYKMPVTVGARGTTVTWLKIGEKFGVALNGIIFDPLADEWWKDTSSWQKNAELHPDMATDLDCNMAHIQGDGAYHYHALPTGLYESLGGKYTWSSVPAPLKLPTIQLGWAFDGTPVYGPLCSNADSLGAGKKNWWKPKSSWALKTGKRGAGTPGGSYNGDYDQDFEYISHGADPNYLDIVNGHFGPTPEYPNGVYHQHITEEFPYIPRGYLNVLAPLTKAESVLTTDALYDQKNINHFKVYPNPSKGILYVQLKGKAVFTLSNTAGNTILTKTINTNREINISHLPSGLYYLKNNTTGEVQKVIISK